MKTKKNDYSDDQKYECYLNNFIRLFGTIGNDDRFKGCLNRLNDECTGFFFVDDNMIWFEYIDKKDGKPYVSTMQPEKYLETNLITRQLKGI